MAKIGSDIWMPSVVTLAQAGHLDGVRKRLSRQVLKMSKETPQPLWATCASVG